MRIPMLSSLTIGVTQTVLLAQAPAATQRDAVQAFVRSYVEAVNRTDVTAWLDMHVRSPELLTVDNGAVTRGWDALRVEGDRMRGTPEGAFRISPGTVAVLSLGVSRALAVSPFVVTVNREPGPVQLRGATTFILDNTPDGWRILHANTSMARPSP